MPVGNVEFGYHLLSLEELESPSVVSSTQMDNFERYSADMRGSDERSREEGMRIFTSGVNAFDGDFVGTAGSA